MTPPRSRQTPAPRQTPASRQTPARTARSRQSPARQAPARQAPARQTPARPAPSRRAAKPVSVRGRRQRRAKAATVNQPRRSFWAMVIMIGLLGTAAVKSVMIQTVNASHYAAEGQDQRERVIALTAQRGPLTDRTGTPLAFTVQGKALAARPDRFANDDQRRAVAETVVAGLAGIDAAKDVTVDAVMKKLLSGKSYVYLARGLMPDQADRIVTALRPILLDKKLDLTVEQQNLMVDAVVTERQDLRQYPAGSVAETVLGRTGWDGHGTSGIETKFDATLAGSDGSRRVDVDTAGRVIPGSAREEAAAVNGTGLRLTLDSDLQYTAEQMLANAVTTQGALGGDVVIMGAGDGQIYAMASYVPGLTAAKTGNRAITSPIEPGSVNKVVTMAAALEQGLITPETVFNVDGSITVDHATVRDAWGHGPVDMTATGILAKSSNVGTLMIAEQLGEKTFTQWLTKFGLGSKSGLELPGEEPGSVPEPGTASWTAGTFANLPIGQGLSMSMVQLASMYQAIANDGVRIAPTIIAGTTLDGVPTPAAPKAQTRVMSAKTAADLRTMLTATTQDGDQAYRGTAPGAAITGYPVAGKTGTAQQVVNGRYSSSMHTSTFAGMVPADKPKYVITIQLNRPQAGNAVPLFHDLAAYAMDAADVPPSSAAAKPVPLYVSTGG